MWGVLLSGFQSVVSGQQLQHHPKNLLECKLSSSPKDYYKLRVGRNNACFNKSSWWVWCVHKFENHRGGSPIRSHLYLYRIRTPSCKSALDFSLPSLTNTTQSLLDQNEIRWEETQRLFPHQNSALCPPRIIHRPEERPDRPISARPFPAAGRRKAACAPASPREGQGLVARITCTSVICEPSARRIFSVLVGYGLSRCLYNHCFRGRAMSCRACRLCRTFPPFCRALGQPERRGRELRPPLWPRGSRLHASQPAWTPAPRARTWRRHWRCQSADGLGVTGQGHQLYTERSGGGGERSWSQRLES